jgi:hypothetical protein
MLLTGSGETGPQRLQRPTQYEGDGVTDYDRVLDPASHASNPDWHGLQCYDCCHAAS